MKLARSMSSGGAQQIRASNSSRRGVVYQNQSAGDCYVNGTGAATLNQNSLKVPSGATYESSPHHVGTGATSVNCALAASPFYAREF